MTSPLWQQASAYAARAHRDQLRKDGRTPYFSHAARVALTLAAKFNCTDETTLAAALLHDVIEDSSTDYDHLKRRFGTEVADLVAVLSKDKRMVEPQREADYHRQLADGPWPARLIKLADVYDNLQDAETDHDKKKLVDRAKRALELAEEDPPLAEACRIVREVIETVESKLACV